MRANRQSHRADIYTSGIDTVGQGNDKRNSERIGAEYNTVQDARFQQAAFNYQNTVLEAAREVEDALTAYLRSQIRVGYLADSVGDARRSVELALVQYRQGSTTYQRVLDTQRFLVRQEDQLAGTRGDVRVNLVATYKALGGGWEKGLLEEAQQ